jgi:predicted nucleic acid-binding protein
LAVLDPDDALVFDLATKANADFIVTFNVKDFPSSADFGVKLITPR